MVPATAAPPVLMKLRLSKVIVMGLPNTAFNVQFSGVTGNDHPPVYNCIQLFYDLFYRNHSIIAIFISY